MRGNMAIRKNSNLIKESNYVYSVSDFYPDLIPAYLAKNINKKIKWIAGYYLFAPNPFSSKSPYRKINFWKGFFYWLMQRPSYFLVKKYADIVFVTSEPDVAKFITRKRDKSKVIVIQGGVDTFESEKYLQSKRVIMLNNRKYDACFVGRFHFQKGVIELIDIWSLVCKKKPEAKLVMIGDGELVDKVEKKISQLGLKKNIELTGFADGDKKYSYFKQSKIIVHPATYDSGGMAAAEGMAWGLPGVSYDLEALKTYYPKGMLKSKVNDKSDFVENIIILLNDKELYKKKSKEALSLTRDIWDWPKRAEKIFNLVHFK